MTNDIEIWKDFASGIVKSAIDDYVECLNLINHGFRHGRDYAEYGKAFDTRIRKKECEDFFKSDWCLFLTNIDGNIIIDKARKKANFDEKDFQEKEAYNID